MTDPRNWITWGAVIMATVVLIFAVNIKMKLSDEKAAHETTKGELAKLRTDAAEKLAEQEKTFRATEDELRATADASRKATNEAVSEATRQRDALRAERLRNAALARATNTVTRTTSVASPGPTPSVDYGAELSGSIGEQEEDEALRAETLRVKYIECYSGYNEAREKLRSFVTTQ